MKRVDVAVEIAFISDDYFSLLGLEEKFSVDEALMERNYIAIQRESHPDRFLAAEEKKLAAERIAKVNRAYLVLRSPLDRAEYLLKIKDVVLNDEERSCIVQEVFEVCDSIEKIGVEMSQCLKNMEDFFTKEEMYQAAREFEKLKYLKKLAKGGVVCSS